VGRGFHALNFAYFIAGRGLHEKYGYFYFAFAFQDGEVQIKHYNVVATLRK
jgi:hypothetical protein